MRHPYNTTILSVYSDERSGADLSRRIKAHLKECSVCLKKAAVFKLIKRMFGCLETLDVPDGFEFELEQRLDKAIVARREIGIVERAARRVLEDIRTVLVPPVPVFVRAATAVLLLLVVCVGTPYYFAKLPLEVTALSGKVEIYSTRNQEWINATEDMVLSASDSIRTGAGGRIDIGIDGIFTVRVKSNTELKMRSMPPRFRKGLVSYEIARGEILVSTTEKFKGSSLEVFTPQAVGRALGTSFVIDVSGAEKRDKTWLAVINGAVEVASRYLPDTTEQRVLVRAGQKTEVITGRRPVVPSLLLEGEWQRLKELYQIGQHTRVILLISATESRVRELLRPCALYILDMEPRVISDQLKTAVSNMPGTVTEKNIAEHLFVINELRMMVDMFPDREYNPQLLMFTGTYYAHISRYEKAIETFESVIKRYPKSQFASLARCAIGIIYDEKLGKKVDARETFERVIKDYPDSLERFEAEKALGMPKS